MKVLDTIGISYLRVGESKDINVEELTTANNLFMMKDIISIVKELNIDNVTIIDVYKHLDFSDEQKTAFKNIINAFPNAVILTTAYANIAEYPQDKYYLKKTIDGKEKLPMDTILNNQSAALEELGFININFYVGYEYKVAFVYNNEAGNKIYEYCKSAVEK